MPLPSVSKKRKICSTLLTFWIPIKSYRRALRGILQLGVRKYFRIKKSDRTTKFENEIAIGAIMKDEGPYLKEWLDFHILAGVKKFYLYDNESTDNTTKILKPYIERGIVEYTYFPGHLVQTQAYVDIINRHYNDTRWLALIDLDEFLVPVKNKNLVDFVHTMPKHASCIVASWVLYGSAGHKTKPKGLVMENYKYRRKQPSGCKSIVNPRLQISQRNPHINFVAGFVVDGSGRKLGRIDQTGNPPPIDYIRCNHYVTKSFAEFKARCARGGPGSGPNSSRWRKKFQNYQLYNSDNIYDDIMDKWIERVKKFKL